jgi:pentatricopeptide repeat protein
MLDFFSSSSSSQPGEQSALISAAEKGGQWKLALEILDEMKDAGFGGNVVAYSAAISACARGQQWRRALQLFREIQAHNGIPSVVTVRVTVRLLPLPRSKTSFRDSDSHTVYLFIRFRYFAVERNDNSIGKGHAVGACIGSLRRDEDAKSSHHGGELR